METEMAESLGNLIDPALTESELPALATLNNAASASPIPHDNPDESRKRKRVSGIVKGSAADFRRKEANRLAADRSRSRANEKRVSIESTAKRLQEENTQLKEELARLELGPGLEQEQEPDTATEQDQEQAQQQDNQSRTILAALMSEAAIGDALNAEGDDVAWMQGVENLLQQAETKDRLGELAAAAVATVPGSGSGSGAQGDGAGVVNGYDAAKAAAATASAMAVAINAQMEGSLRDELARTKAAILRVERDVLRHHGQEVPDDTTPSTLPENIFAADMEVLRVQAKTMQDTVASLEAELPVLRDLVVRSRDAKVEEEIKVAGVVAELRGLAMGDDEDRINSVLKGAGGFVASLLGGTDAGNSPTTYSSAAIARRRRGRPPKSAINAEYTNNLHYTPSKIDQLPKTRRPRRSRANQVNPDTSIIEPQLEEAEHGLEISQDQENEQDQDTQATDQATAEQYILSHLAHAHEQDDSTSFAEFLPTDLPMDTSLDETTVVATTEGHMEGLHPFGEDVAEQITQAEGSTTPSVLSRFKKGGPGSCDICGRTETTVWRKLVLGGKDHRVCNPCGLYHIKFGVIRPPELWGDGLTYKKRRPATRYPAPRRSKDNSKEEKLDTSDVEGLQRLVAEQGGEVVQGQAVGEGDGEGVERVQEDFGMGLDDDGLGAEAQSLERAFGLPELGLS